MAISEKDIQFREIITKAVCAKGRKYTQAKHTLTPPHAPSSILGCWIINHEYKAEKNGEMAEVQGSYEINVWYSYANNGKTEVATETIRYEDQVPLSYIDHQTIGNGQQVHVKSTQPPTASEATISNAGNAVLVQVERECMVEVIGETKVCVLVHPHACEDDDEKEFAYEENDAEFEDLDPDILIDDLD